MPCQYTIETQKHLGKQVKFLHEDSKLLFVFVSYVSYCIHPIVSLLAHLWKPPTPMWHMKWSMNLPSPGLWYLGFTTDAGITFCSCKAKQGTESAQELRDG